MKINTSSYHYKWGKTLLYWSIWRSESKDPNKRPKSLCSYFWVWMVLPPFASVVSAVLAVAAVIVVGMAGAAYFVGPASLAVSFFIDPNMYETLCPEGLDACDKAMRVKTSILDTGNWAWIGLAALQLFLWFAAMRKIVFETTVFPESSTVRIVKETVIAAKQGVCPLVTYDEGEPQVKEGE